MQLDCNILLVDDQAPMRRLVDQYLKVIGFKNVEFAVNGSDALAKVKAKQPNGYDIIFVDWDMPEMTGIEFVKSCRKLLSEPPEFIMLTGRREKQDIMVARETDIKWYIAKPVSKNTLVERLNAVFKSKE